MTFIQLYEKSFTSSFRNSFKDEFASNLEKLNDTKNEELLKYCVTKYVL